MTLDYLQVLNIRYLTSSGFEGLLGESEDAPRYLPPISWLEPPPEEEGRAVEDSSKLPVLQNGRPVPSRSDFYTRIKELYHINDEAFRTLNQVPNRDKRGHPQIRLAHFRRFWEGLDNMAFYWDTSHDEYIAPTPQDHDEGNDDVSASVTEQKHNLPVRESHTLSPDPALEESRKRSKQHHPNNNDPIETTHHCHIEAQHHHPPLTHTLASSFGLRSLVHDGRHQTPPPNPANSNDTNSPPPGTMYRGQRIGSGSSMPELHRVDTVRSFIEPLAWSWGFSVSVHRRPTLVAIKKLRIPVRITTAVWRVPKEREKAKGGWLEGPVMGVSCRNETGFGDQDGDVRDLLREVGALIVLAQERAREGKTEVKPGEGKWWTTVPRWGGGPGGEVGEGRGIGDDPVPEGQIGQNDEGNNERSRGRPSGKDRRKFSAMDAWKAVRAGMGYWDPRLQYEAIGRTKGGDYDEVSSQRSLQD